MVRLKVKPTHPHLFQFLVVQLKATPHIYFSIPYGTIKSGVAAANISIFIYMQQKKQIIKKNYRSNIAHISSSLSNGIEREPLNPLDRAW